MSPDTLHQGVTVYVTYQMHIKLFANCCISALRPYTRIFVLGLFLLPLPCRCKAVYKNVYLSIYLQNYRLCKKSVTSRKKINTGFYEVTYIIQARTKTLPLNITRIVSIIISFHIFSMNLHLTEILLDQERLH